MEKSIKKSGAIFNKISFKVNDMLYPSLLLAITESITLGFIIALAILSSFQGVLIEGYVITVSDASSLSNLKGLLVSSIALMLSVCAVFSVSELILLKRKIRNNKVTVD
jgi:hypothetical protein